MNTTIYILVAVGRSSVFESRKQIICKTAFRKMPTDEQKSAFGAICTQRSESSIDEIGEDTLSVQVIELTLKE